MARSLKIKDWYIPRVKTALRRAGYTSQKDLASKLEMSVDTVHKFLNGKPIDTLNFIDVSKALHFDWEEIADMEDYDTTPRIVVEELVDPDSLPVDVREEWLKRGNTEVLSPEVSLESLAQQNVEILVNLFNNMRQQLPETISHEVVAGLVKTALIEANITLSKLDSGKHAHNPFRERELIMSN
jgi:hypothetical protein